MKALKRDGSLTLDGSFPTPTAEGEALIEVIAAGICSTDLEILKGYAGFKGVLGHEFVGRVVDAPPSERALVGRRVAGEINAGCGRCDICRAGDARHCPGRTVLGIKGRNGAFAQYLSLPAKNLIEVPAVLSDDEAVFIEPVAAACEILDRVVIGSQTCVCVIGDGKLGQLIVRVLLAAGCELTLAGKHLEKLRLAQLAGAETIKVESDGSIADPKDKEHRFDVVVEASGSPSGLELALSMIKPRGTVVLKSTHHDRTLIDLSQVVVNEVILVGSRCGRFEPAMQLLATRVVRVDDLISDRFPLDQWEAAFARAAEPSSLKVLFKM